MSYHFKNLVFEGGGVKGIAYIGAMQVLEEKGILVNIERVGGTSAGAINAVLFALGFSINEQRTILRELDFNDFKDDNIGVLRDTNRLLNQFGWYKGEFFRKWIGGFVEERLNNENATFRDLREQGFLDLYVYGTNLSTGFGEVFSFEHTPHMRLVDAVRISMSIPLFFSAVRNARDDVYVDGGVINNFPVKLFDREKYIYPSDLQQMGLVPSYYKEENSRFLSKHPGASPYVYNKETLGFRLDSKQEIAVFRDGAEAAHKKIDDFFDYVGALVNSILEIQGNTHLHSDDWQRTIYIDTLGVSTTDFDLSDEKKQALETSGADSTKKYFDSWYDVAENSPFNHPNS